MLIRPCNHSYPERHRVCDIEVDGKYYRILRCVTCSERLAFEQIREESACTSVLGLPLWLTGEHLRRWVANEKKLQTQMSEHLEVTDGLQWSSGKPVERWVGTDEEYDRLQRERAVSEREILDTARALQSRKEQSDRQLLNPQVHP